MTQSPLKFEVPWERYGLIAALVKELHPVAFQLGKTVMQKVVYLLQALEGVPAGYRFQFYTYGPFAVELLQDLDQVEALEGVRIHRVLSGTGGFNIEPGDKAGGLIRKASSLLEEEGAGWAISRIVTDYGHLPAKDLELRATIVYVVRSLERRGKPVDNERLKELVGNLKPRFERQEIEEAILEFPAKGYLGSLAAERNGGELSA